MQFYQKRIPGISIKNLFWWIWLKALLVCLFIFSKNQLLVSLIFLSFFFIYSHFDIYYFLLPILVFSYSFSSFFKYTFRFLFENFCFPVVGLYSHYKLLKTAFAVSYQFSSVQSLSLSDSLQHHGIQHTRLLCPSPIPGAYSNSCPSSQWCHPTTSSSVLSFSSCLQSFPASGCFPISQLFASGGQSIGVSASASVLQWIFRTDFL